MRTTLGGMLPRCSRAAPTRRAFDACIPGLSAQPTMQRKVDMVRAYGLTAAMAAVELEFLTPSGFISCIGGVVVAETMKLVGRFLKQQVRGSGGLLLAHNSVGSTFGCFQVAARSCHLCESRHRQLQPSDLDWRRAIRANVLVADKVTPQMWTEAAVAALARKYLLTPLAYSLTRVQARLWPSMVMSGFRCEGWGECWSGFTRGVHGEGVCDWRGDGGQLFVCRHPDGSSHTHNRTNVPHYRVHALLAVSPRPVPGFHRRECWVNWAATRWMDVVELPTAGKRWFVESTLLKHRVNAMAAVDVCAALAHSFPVLERWKQMMTEAEAPHWEDVSPADCDSFLAALRRPPPTREGMEGIVASLVGAARRCASSMSFKTGGAGRPLFNVASIFRLMPSALLPRRSSRIKFQLKYLSVFGMRSTDLNLDSFSAFALQAVTAVCRWASTLDVFPVADDVAAATSAMAIAAAAAAAAAATALANADIVTDAVSALSPAVNQAGRGDWDGGDNDAGDDDEAGAHNEAGGAGGGHGDGGDDEAGAYDEAGAHDEAGGAGGGDGDGGTNVGHADDDDEESDGEAAAAELLPPAVVDCRLRNPRMQLAPGGMLQDLLLWFNRSRPILMAHGTLPRCSPTIRRWGLWDPVIRWFTRSAIPPGCSAVYVAPVLSDLTVAFCASFVIQRHVRLNNGAQPTSVEVVLFRADPDVLYAPTATVASPYVWGGALPSRPHSRAMGVLNALQLRAGRWVNFCVLNGMQVVRFVFVHPVVAACGMAEAMYGHTLGAQRNADEVAECIGTSRFLKPVASILFEVATEAA